MFSGYHRLDSARGRLHFGCIFSPGLANDHFIRLLQSVWLRVVVGDDVLDRIPPDRHLSFQLNTSQVGWPWPTLVLQRRHVRVWVEFQVALEQIVCASVFFLDAFYQRESRLLRIEGHLVISRQDWTRDVATVTVSNPGAWEPSSPIFGESSPLIPGQ